MSKFTDTLKEAKVKVTKDGCAGYYIYNGINFTVKFNSEECETSWWEVNIFYNECPKEVEKNYSWLGNDCCNQWETKRELILDLFELDQSLSK
tara:strand:+ start:168 stop:446 length:279 start_codon:yes stop_codon:yes gene_type:complete